MNFIKPLILVSLLGGAALAQSTGPSIMPPISPDAAHVVVPDNMTARLNVQRYTSSPVTLTLTLQNLTGKQQEISSPRDNRQECSFGPMVRVLEVGTRKVVYPPEGAGNVMLCAQDMFVGTIPAGGTIKLERELELPKGDYMVESWFAGYGLGGTIKVPAEAKRLTVW
ncbi:hypothetical protein [Deinococcus radiophilus]|uniref:Copper chaperone PCu(A)C n=2 Tax=Deinococcus radiophilus TaxID=32062 RepID=A0A3S0IK89_9DEIO|nr:hypothetical protein [Deinococcus radiophilus]RTR25911.1 hypothetical protein EJ104_09395 [Deinococcus radiophilus]UFA49702.1 hypothetical protein LMT64_07315 [Deinococcus radiophilus]